MKKFLRSPENYLLGLNGREINNGNFKYFVRVSYIEKAGTWVDLVPVK